MYYKPQGIPLSSLKEVVVSPEELETLRLRYIEDLSQDEAAEKMGISQSQYQRDLVNTLKKITKALISGDAISIPNGNK
jgi:RNA polymerase sigma factor (sigma-70 family)